MSERAGAKRGERYLVVAGSRMPVVIARHKRACRYVVRVTRDGRVRLTVPRGASIAGGLAFADRQTDWIAREWRQHHDRLRPWTEGTMVWLRGEHVPLTILDAGVALGDTRIDVNLDGQDLRTAVEARLRTIGERELSERCLQLARRCNLTASRVAVRNHRSRWGSCSPSRVISLNWRLVQMPSSVRDYVIFHELMHLRQPNHSPRFWREVDAVCPTWRESERWLKKYGRQLI